MAKKTPGRKKRSTQKSQSKFALAALVIVACAAAVFIMQVSAQIPDFSDIASTGPYESTIIYSADGSVLGTIHAGQKRISVPISKISPYLIKAVIASEDSDFFGHKGISMKAILRASLANILRGHVVQGGSTITQQLARTMFLTTKKTMGRKFSEMYYAVELEKNYTKEEILEMYLNQVYWGHNTYGADAAAQLYFGKHADTLSLGESALLAGILGAPEYYSPYKNFDLAVKRRDVVLQKMKKLGMIDENRLQKGEFEKINLSMGKVNKYKFNAPYFTNYIISQLVEKYGGDVVYKGGLRIYTTLSMPIQRAAEDSVSQFVTKEGPKYRFSQAALTAIDPNTGYILAMVGGSDFDNSEYNRAVQAKRSPGSSFKPFVYTTAIEQGYSPGDVINDSPTAFNVFPDAKHPDGKWRPRNFDKKFRGPVTLQYALENSLNLPAIKLLEKIGIENVINTARRMGITSPLTPTLSLTLGTSDVSLLEMVSAFGIFAANGMRAEPVSITKVTDKDGKVLEMNQIRETQILDPNIAAVMVSMMKGVITSGTGRRANIGRPAAAKTGTSDSFKDAWFVGYVPQVVAGVWVGNDNNTPMRGVAEVSICPRMWKLFMTTVLKNTPVEDFPKPTNLVRCRVCTISGLLPGPNCPAKRIKWGLFWADKAPKKYCTNPHGTQPEEESAESEDNPAAQKDNQFPSQFDNTEEAF